MPAPAPRLAPVTNATRDSDKTQPPPVRAIDRIDSFLVDASRSTFIWFRMIVTQTMVDLHRRHVGAQKRSAAKEHSIHGGWSSDSTVPAGSLANASSVGAKTVKGPSP